MRNKKLNNIEESLLNILDKDEAFVIALYGSWGIGKTFFWHQFSDEELKKDIVYVSLFGKDNIQSIDSTIATKVLLDATKILLDATKIFNNSILKKLLKKITKNKIFSEEVTELLKKIAENKISNRANIDLLPKASFQNTIICIDDIERISNDIELQDILGIISMLKEQKECSVVMIFNKDKIEEGKTDILAEYKDKVIDYEFLYNPTPKEAFDIIKSKIKIKFNEDNILTYLQKCDIKNIRIISRIINALNDFEFILDKINNHLKIEKEIVDAIMLIAVLNAQTSNLDYGKLFSYISEKKSLTSKIGDEKENNKNKEYDKLEKYFISSENDDIWSFDDYAYHINDIKSLVIDYIKTSIINKDIKDKVNAIIKDRIKHYYLYNINEQQDKIYRKRHFDFNYTSENFVKDLWQVMQDNENNLVFMTHRYLNPINFIHAIKALKEEDEKNKNKYHTFAVSKLKKLLDNIPSLEDDFDSKGKILGFAPEVKTHYDKLVAKQKEVSIDSKEKIIATMQEIRKNISWNNEPESFAKISQENIKQFIIDSPDFISGAELFIKKYNSNGFEVYAKNIINVLKELKESSNITYKEKAKKILYRLADNESLKTMIDE